VNWKPVSSLIGVSLAHKVVTPSIIVWDLETVPDLAGVVAANDLVGKSDGEIPRGLKISSL
jgi:hypothetical protein